MVENHEVLRVAALTPDMHDRTCGYWYAVTSRASAHHAFRTRAALERWATDRGLVLPSLPNAIGEWGGGAIVGKYRTNRHMDPAALDGLTGKRIRMVDNGEWTDGVITTDDDGLRTVHYLNCNVRTRALHDWRECQKLEDAGQD